MHIYIYTYTCEHKYSTFISIALFALMNNLNANIRYYSEYFCLFFLNLDIYIIYFHLYLIIQYLFNIIHIHS